jgi:hypothetical protein
MIKLYIWSIKGFTDKSPTNLDIFCSNLEEITSDANMIFIHGNYIASENADGRAHAFLNNVSPAPWHFSMASCWCLSYYKAEGVRISNGSSLVPTSLSAEPAATAEQPALKTLQSEAKSKTGARPTTSVTLRNLSAPGDSTPSESSLVSHSPSIRTTGHFFGRDTSSQCGVRRTSKSQVRKKTADRTSSANWAYVPRADPHSPLNPLSGVLLPWLRSGASASGC